MIVIIVIVIVILITNRANTNNNNNNNITHLLLPAQHLVLHLAATARAERERPDGGRYMFTPNPPTNIVGFRGFDSSIILSLRGGILTPIGNFPESLSQAMLVGTMLVGRLGVVLPFSELCLVKRNRT